ncbi:hypothetical protein HPB52_021873 [Rhipicephalus sanguineus]|uniref:Cornichon n=1 Tax=Rhipicephalus sanguineus TaxID=34632 RepID=A0A9D4SR11_RHISA|nr:hypothetical protein HPB52_021873 [Rhipicephalus sanguineus]
MAFNFVALCYIVALILTAFLIFMAVFHVIAFDELKNNYKNPIEQCDSLNPLVLPEYFVHILYNVLFLCAGELFTVLLNLPLIAYHINRERETTLDDGSQSNPRRSLPSSGLFLFAKPTSASAISKT